MKNTLPPPCEDFDHSIWIRISKPVTQEDVIICIIRDQTKLLQHNLLHARTNSHYIYLIYFPAIEDKKLRQRTNWYQSLQYLRDLLGLLPKHPTPLTCSQKLIRADNKENLSDSRRSSLLCRNATPSSICSFLWPTLFSPHSCTEDVSQIVFVLPTYLQIIVHKSLEKETHTKYLGRIPSLIGSLTPLNRCVK